MASIFKRYGRGAYIISWHDHEGRRREKSSRTTDLAVARRIAAKIQSEVALRREGIVNAQQDRLASENRKPLSKHVEDYLDHCRHVGLSPKHVVEKERHLEGLLAGTGAARLSELTADLVEGNLRSLRESGLSARTVNFRRQVAVAFLNWCLRVGRVGSNPLEVLPKLDEDRDRRRVRRALTDEEVARLMEVAEPRGRKGWYMVCVLAGLRKGELSRLAWGEVDLDHQTLTVRFGKSRREDVVPLHPELAEELRRMRPEAVLPKARVFPHVVTDRTRRRDFERADIPIVDEEGRVADLHALRTTLGTRLAREGIAPQIGQRIMRHADYRTTLKHYTVLGLTDTASAVRRLPGVGSPRAEQATGTAGLDPQQFPQHSGVEMGPAGARSCENSGSRARVPKPSQLLHSARKSEEVRAGALERATRFELATFSLGS